MPAAHSSDESKRAPTGKVLPKTEKDPQRKVEKKQLRKAALKERKTQKVEIPKETSGQRHVLRLHGECANFCTTPAATTVYTITDDCAQAIAEACVRDHLQARPGDAKSNTPPSEMKAYLMWAFLSRMRDSGMLTGSYAQTFPSFPPDYYLPNAFWVFLSYVAPYHEDGYNGGPQITGTLNITAEPAFNRTSIGGGGTGYSANKITTMQTFVQVIDGTTKEVYWTDSAYSGTLTSATLAASVYNDRFVARGCAAKYGDLKPFAVDASFYVSRHADDLTLSCSTRHFDPEVAAAICAYDSVDVDIYPYRKVKPCLAAVTCGMGNASGFYQAIQVSQFVWLCNRLEKVKYRKLRKYLNYKGTPLNTLQIMGRSIDQRKYHEIVDSSVQEMVRATNGASYSDAAHATMAAWVAVCDIAFAAVTTSTLYWQQENVWQRRTAPLLARDWELPVPVSAYLQGIGPVVRHGQLVLPTPNYVNNAFNYMVDFVASGTIFGGIAAAGDSWMTLNWSGAAVAPGIVVDGVTLNPAWATAQKALTNYNGTLLNLADSIYRYAYGTQTGTGRLTANMFSPIEVHPFGATAVLVDVRLASNSNPVAVQIDLGGQTQGSFVIPDLIGSPIPLVGSDLVEAIMFCYIVNTNIADEGMFRFSVPQLLNTGLDRAMARETLGVDTTFSKLVAKAKERDIDRVLRGQRVTPGQSVRKALDPFLNTIQQQLEAAIPPAAAYAQKLGERYAQKYFEGVVTEGVAWMMGAIK